MRKVVVPVLYDLVHSFEKPPERSRNTEQPPKRPAHAREERGARNDLGQPVQGQNIAEPEREKGELCQDSETTPRGDPGCHGQNASNDKDRHCSPRYVPFGCGGTQPGLLAITCSGTTIIVITHTLVLQ